ncbi:MAG TPA: hypothetical protein DCK76_01610 [Desulfotomaculum sp.]|nr:hypothetical protein [Desulfotomaculum sp.]HBY04442.1 hypothetical protein [Desulfotomaculum sp.]
MTRLFYNSIPCNEHDDQVLQAAYEYLQRDWKIVPIPKGSKAPIIPGWQNIRLIEEELPGYFPQGQNVGVLQGEPSGGLTDFDLDSLEAVDLAEWFLPPTGARFGRPGKPLSHWLYVTDIKTRKFETKADGMILETRSTGCQTVFPPSTHPSGELISWHDAGEPAQVEAVELKTSACRLAAAALLARHWSAEGSRQNVALALSGALLRAGWSVNDAKYFIKAVAHAAGDEEADKRADTVDNTARNQDTGKTTGWRSLGELIGADVVSKAREWLGILDFADYEWPDPEPIQNKLLPVDQLPSGIIPEPFRPWLEDVAYRMQCPVDFVAVGAIVAAGAIIGAGCGIRPKQKDDWPVVPNLWGGIIARPSMMKTPALKEVMNPIDRLEIEAKKEHEELMGFHNADVEEFKAKKKALVSEMEQAAKGKHKKSETPSNMDDVKARYAALEEPKPPTRQRYRTNDSTIEKLAELLNENPRGLLLFRDELVGLLVSWDREDRQTDRAFYLEAWNGQGAFTTDRIGRGTIDTQNLCISILGGIQPSKLTGYLYQANDDLKNDGLLQRFQLLVYPDEPANWSLIDEYPDIEAKNRAYEIFKRLSEINFLEYGAEISIGEKISYYHFSPEAQEIFNDWLTELQTKLQTEESPLIVEHLSKYRSLMPSLALIFHLINIADGQAGGPVSSLAGGQAAAWCDI